MQRDYTFGQAMKTQLLPLLFGVIFGGVGLFITTIFILIGGAPWVDWQLDSSSVSPIDAQVENIYLEQNMHVNGQNPTAIQYRFEINGKIYRGKSRTLDSKLIESATKNKTVQVLHLPENPTVNKICGTDYSFFGYFCLLPMAFAVVGGAIFLFGLVRARTRYRMVHDGVMTTGRVTEVTTNPYVRSNRQHQLVVSYEFTTSTHENLHNVYHTFDYGKYGSLSVGNEVPVIYDEFFPTRNTLLL